jgi:lysylphosphatidylglycerol synthetase-like protein (DUF2156 family)
MAAHIDHPSGYLALSPRNRFFFGGEAPAAAPDRPVTQALADGEGFIAYRPYGRHWFLFGGVHAPADRQPALLDAFLARAGRQGCAVVAVQLRHDQLALFAGRGFTINRFGTSFGLRLDGFRLSGTRRMKLRNKIGRARRLGLRVLEVGRELPRSPQTFAALDAISGRWLRRKGKKELDFMIGELGAPDDPRRRIFVVTGPDGRPSDRSPRNETDTSPGNETDTSPGNETDTSTGNETDTSTGNETDTSTGNGLRHTWLGFITYVPVFGGQPGYLHDLTRRLPDAPPGAMELCNAFAMDRLHSEGAAYLHFGFTPFVVDADEPLPPTVNSSRWLGRAVRLLYRHGRLVYPAQSQADYKRKWGPDLIEPEYVAARPLSLRAIWDLLRLTRSL